MQSKESQIILSNLFWKLMERGGTQGIQFLIQLILARILAPEDFGMLAIITIFITLANTFIQSSFNSALIQKRTVDEIDFSSVFLLSMIVACLMYGILFAFAPWIAAFYNSEKLTTMLRVLSLILFFGAINSIQNAVISREMQFKKFFISSLVSILVSGIFGIVLAFQGYGVWALIIQQIINKISITIVQWFTVNWRPRFLISFKRIRVLFSFGWKLLVSSLLDTIYHNLSSLVIGKIYNTGILGFFSKGEQFPLLIITNINGSIQAVMFPALASQQDNLDRVRNMMKRSITTSSFIIFPMMALLIVIAKPLVLLLLTEKWLPCVPFLKIACCAYAFWPIHTANLQAISALGRSDIFLKLEVIKKIVGLVVLVITLNWGIYAIAWGAVISGLLSTVINAFPNKKLLNYSYVEQWKDIMPSLLLSIGIGVLTSLFQLNNMSIWLAIVMKICVGITTYIAFAWILKYENLRYILLTIRRISSKDGRTAV